MKINKDFKLELIASKDETRHTLKSIYVMQNGRSWAIATDGKALAQVPVELEEGELSKGNSIKASDFKFQRSNPAIKKQAEMFCFLQPIEGQYPNTEMIWPKDEAKTTVLIDIELLYSLSRALGTEKLKLEITDNEKAIRVYSTKSEAKGLIMPCKL